MNDISVTAIETVAGINQTGLKSFETNTKPSQDTKKPWMAPERRGFTDRTKTI